MTATPTPRPVQVLSTPSVSRSTARRHRRALGVRRRIEDADDAADARRAVPTTPPTSRRRRRRRRRAGRRAAAARADHGVGRHRDDAVAGRRARRDRRRERRPSAHRSRRARRRCWSPCGFERAPHRGPLAAADANDHALRLRCGARRPPRSASCPDACAAPRAGRRANRLRVSQARQRQRDDDDEAEPPVSSERRSHDDLSVDE